MIFGKPVGDIARASSPSLIARIVLTLILGLMVAMIVSQSSGTAHGATADEPMRVAVWPFDSYVSAKDRSAEEAHLLEELLPELASGELLALGKIQLLERRQLGDILKEQKLGASDLADESTRLRLGRLLGARWMLFGHYIKFGAMWQIDLRVVNAETSQIIATGSVTGTHEDYLSAVRAAVGQIARRMP